MKKQQNISEINNTLEEKIKNVALVSKSLDNTKQNEEKETNQYIRSVAKMLFDAQF